MVAYTTTYSFAKPTVGDDEDVWGGYLNGNFDTLESLLKGTTALTAINVTGNITVGGNVDGRDIAADGSKLDGIESGATADQTKADIDALNINAATLDSLDSTQFLRSDAADSGTGSITLTTGANPSMTLVSDDFGEQLIVKRNHASNSAGINFQNTSGSQGTFFLDSTGPKWNNGSTSYKIWHETNDGSGSGLDADNLDGRSWSTTRNSANTLVTRDGSGYTNLGWINTTSGATTNTINKIYASYDDYVRYVTPATLISQEGIWTSSNDGSGSGLDADTVDGIQASSFLRSDANDTATGELTFNSKLDIANGTYLGWGGGTNRPAITGNKTSNVMEFHAGGSERLRISTSGVQLGDTGNGYFQPVSGDYGSIQIDGGAHNSWEGYSIGGRAVFMHDNNNVTALWDDVNDKWLYYAQHNGPTYMYHNGTYKFNTNSTGANIQGDLNAVDNVYVAGSLIHEGDTDTFINFQNNIIYINAGNSTNFTCATAYTNVNKPLYNYSVYYEDYDALSGTSVTVNCDTAQAFSLTMTGNTTFTFNSVSSAWSTGFVLELTGNGGTVTWPTSVDWAGGTAPDAPASGETDIYAFWTRDGGTTWYGVLSVDAAA